MDEDHHDDTDKRLTPLQAELLWWGWALAMLIVTGAMLALARPA